MVEVGLAFVCALVAWSAAAALGARAYRRPAFAVVVWVASVLAITVALSAAFPAALLDFSGTTFRIFQIGVGLVGPLLLGWGVIEYTVDSSRGRFGVRLVVATLAVVPLVILTMDRLRGRFDASYPAASEHYDVIPMGVLTLAHVFAVVAVAVGLLLAALRTREEPVRGRGELAVVGLVAAAVLLEIVVSRFGLGALGQLMLLAAIAALWVAVVRATAPPRRRRRGRGDDDFDDPEDDDFFDFDDDYDEPVEEEPVRRRRRRAQPEDEPAPRSRGTAQRLHGIITVYTLLEGHEDTFDEEADEVVEEVSRLEPDTLLFACHTVANAPLQRIVYAIYRDQLAYEEHEQQPHVVDFTRRALRHVAATNVIELALSGASAADDLPDWLLPH